MGAGEGGRKRRRYGEAYGDLQGEVVGLLAFVIGYLLKDRFLFFFNNLKKKIKIKIARGSWRGC